MHNGNSLKDEAKIVEEPSYRSFFIFILAMIFLALIISIIWVIFILTGNHG